MQSTTQRPVASKYAPLDPTAARTPFAVGTPVTFKVRVIPTGARTPSIPQGATGRVRSRIGDNDLVVNVAFASGSPLAAAYPHGFVAYTDQIVETSRFDEEAAL